MGWPMNSRDCNLGVVERGAGEGRNPIKIVMENERYYGNRYVSQKRRKTHRASGELR